MRRVSIRLRLDLGADCAVGPGKIALLEAVEASGSLSQAARELEMSYRRAWLLLDSLNTSFSHPVALLATGGKGGGGASLTPLGRELVSTYRDFERDLQKEAGQRFRRLGGLTVTTAAPTGTVVPRRRLSRKAPNADAVRVSRRAR